MDERYSQSVSLLRSYSPGSVAEPRLTVQEIDPPALSEGSFWWHETAGLVIYASLGAQPDTVVAGGFTDPHILGGESQHDTHRDPAVTLADRRVFRRRC